MIRICLIRHGMTVGNTRGRYIGITDEPLCSEGRQLLCEAVQKGVYPAARFVYSSPLLRCRETAELIYPGQEIRTEELLRECDFGSFENKNYRELASDPDYQRWVDSGGALPFPGGESKEGFSARCREGFARVLAEIRREQEMRRADGELSRLFAVKKAAAAGREEELAEEMEADAALVVHGGTIMSVLEAYGEPEKPFYEWHVKNGEGYRVLLDETAYEERGEIRLYEIHHIGPLDGLSD